MMHSAMMTARDRGAREVVSVLLIYLVLAPLIGSTFSIVAASTAPTRARSQMSIPGIYHPIKQAMLKYNILVIPLSRIPQLIGADIRSLRVFIQTQRGLIETEALILPRGIYETLIPEVNRTVPLPYYGSPRITVNDILVIKTPITFIMQNVVSQARALPLQGCSGIATQLAPGQDYEAIKIAINKGSPLLEINPLQHTASERELLEPLTLCIYYSKTMIPPRVGTNPSLFREISLSLLGRIPRNTIELDELRRALVGLAAEKITIQSITRSTTEPKAVPEYITPGPVENPPKFYWFSIILSPVSRTNPVNKSNTLPFELSATRQSFERWIYLGPYVYSTGLHLKVEGGDNGGCFKAVFELWSYDPVEGSPKNLVKSIALGPYYLSANENRTIDTYLTPPSLSDKPLEAHIKLIWCGGSVKVILPTIEFLKSYPSTPLAQTEEAIDVLSHAIAAAYPQESRLTKYVTASNHYANGVHFNAGAIDTVTLDISSPNGIYLDYSSNSDNAYLLVDVLVKNTGYNTVSGELEVQINGYAYETKSIIVYPESYSVIRFTIPYRYYTDYVEWGTGGYVTIHTNIRNWNVELYIDSALIYKYLPEVWSPSSRSWIDYETPALKYAYNLGQGSLITYKAGLIITNSFIKPSRDYTGARLEVSRTEVGGSINKIEIIYKIPKSIALGPAGYGYKDNSHTEEEVEKYIGAANTVHHLIATGITVLSFIISIPETVSGAVFVSGIAIDILYSAVEHGELNTYTETINNMKYIVYDYVWTRGWFSNPSFVEMIITPDINAETSDASIYTVYISATINDVQTIHASTLLHVVNPNIFTGPDEPPGFYGRGDIGYS